VEKLTRLIPMGRMARVGEYRAAIQFLLLGCVELHDRTKSGNRRREKHVVSGCGYFSPAGVKGTRLDFVSIAAQSARMAFCRSA
jgi:hypothetical protein